MRRSAKEVMVESAQRLGLSYSDMVSSDRRWQFSHPRQEAMFDVYVQCPHMSYPAIGKLFGGRDHTTALHSVQRHCERIGVSYEKIKRRTDSHQEVRIPKRNFFPPSSIQAYRDAARVA